MYIRTKDGVYDTNKRHYEIEIDILYEIVWDDTYTEYGVNGKYSRGKVISQSENLEELCDEFVMTHYFKETDYTYHEVLKAGKDSMIEAVRLKKINNKSKAIKNEFNIYGCIWTDDGLIYVAKMDSEGKLVLI